MKIIRTVLGDIRPEELGLCDAHEHLIRSGGVEVERSANFLMDSIEAAGMELSRWLDAGGKSMVCMDPIGCGRNVPKMLALAEQFRGRAHLLMCTGFHKGELYDNNCHWLATVEDESRIADLLVKEITEGMDRHSYNGPVVDRVDAKAGLVKAGTGMGMISDLEYKALRVAVMVQKQTGAPISIHTQMGTMAREITDYLDRQGADLSKVILCHLQKTADRYYHREVLQSGAYLCYDLPDREHFVPDQHHIENIAWLVGEGYRKKLLLSMDAGVASMQSGYMELAGRYTPGITYLLTSLSAQMRAMGIQESVLEDLWIHNPAQAFSFDVT